MTHLEVTNSKFLGPISIDLNPQYNALIGGRGTGKSTILEYLRLGAMPSQPEGSDDVNEVAEFQRRRTSLVANTLIPFGASIDVSFLLSDVPHVVRRKASGELSIKIADRPFGPCTEENVRELLPIRAFSQKQLSAVGARLEELTTFCVRADPGRSCCHRGANRCAPRRPPGRIREGPAEARPSWRDCHIPSRT